MPIKTSLRPEVINRIPVTFDKKKGKYVGIYHRPLVGSGILLKGGPGESINKRLSETCRQGKKIVANSAEFRLTEFENPNVNALKAFECMAATDNFYQTRRLVLTFNHPGRRDVDKIGTYRIAYHRTLEDCNCCYYCKMPIKMQRYRIEGDSRKKPDPFFAEEPKLNKLVKQRDGGTKIRSVGGTPLRGIRYRTSTKPANTFYGVIKSHFRYVPLKDKDGKIVKYRFVYFDGTKRRIEMRKRPGTKIRYFVHVKPDGTEEKIIPQSSYRKDVACKCGKRNK